MEKWVSLEDYPGYSASNMGLIRNDKRDRILAVVRTESRHTYVSLMQGGKQVTRGVAKLIADAFVENPRPKQFTTPIHLNGDLTNCKADNLLWRPRWFAMRFTQQFAQPQQSHAPIRNKATGEVFEDLWVPVKRYGLLYTEILTAVASYTYVFPTMQTFEWV